MSENNNYNYNQGKRKTTVGNVGAVGGLDPYADDMALFEEKMQAKFNQSQQKGPGWREQKIRECMVILKSEAADDYERDAATRELALFYDFDLHKLKELKRQLKYTTLALEQQEKLVAKHAKDWGEEVVKYGTHMNEHPNEPYSPS